MRMRPNTSLTWSITVITSQNLGGLLRPSLGPSRRSLVFPKRVGDDLEQAYQARMGCACSGTRVRRAKLTLVHSQLSFEGGC